MAKIEFHFKKSLFSLKSWFKEWKGADEETSLYSLTQQMVFQKLKLYLGGWDTKRSTSGARHTNKTLWGI